MSPPLDPARALKAWRVGLSRVDPCQPPADWRINQWVQWCDDAFWLLDHFAEQAARDGWSALDLFGVLPARPGWGGLCDRLRGARNLKMDADRAVWSLFGERETWCRGAGDDLRASGLVLLWEVGR